MFERIKYPDGQISAKWVQGDNSHVIKQRINSYEDLMFLAAIGELAFDKDEKFSLEIPCLLAQRSDRRFDPNQSLDLRVVADVINNCNFSRVEIFDPHSDVTMYAIRRSVKKTSFDYVSMAVSDLYRPETGINTCNFTLVSPDAGAYKKVFDYGEKMNLPVVAAVKHRDAEGKIDLVFMGDVKDKHCLIVDDLCDGGKTFLDLGKKLKEQGAQKVYLYVSHGLFSRGFKTFDGIIDHIYCTNSVKDLNIRNIARDEGMFDFVTQYKVI